MTVVYDDELSTRQRVITIIVILLLFIIGCELLFIIVVLTLVKKKDSEVNKPHNKYWIIPILIPIAVACIYMSILTIILHCLRKSERIIVKRRSLFNYSGEFRSPVPPSVTPTPHTVLSSPTNTSEMTVQMEPERVSTLIELQKAQIISIFDDGKTKPSRKTDDIKDTEQMDVHTSSSVPVPDIKKKSVIQEKLHKSIVKAQQTLPDAHAFNKRVEKKLHGRQVQNLVLEEE